MPQSDNKQNQFRYFELSVSTFIASPGAISYHIRQHGIREGTNQSDRTSIQYNTIQYDTLFNVGKYKASSQVSHKI